MLAYEENELRIAEDRLLAGESAPKLAEMEINADELEEAARRVREIRAQYPHAYGGWRGLVGMSCRPMM